MRLRALLAAATVTVLLAPHSASAQKLFEIRAESAAVPGFSESIKGNQMIDLIDEFFDASGELGPVLGLGYSGRLSYLGIQNALELQILPGGQTAVLQIPLTGVTQTFQGSDPDALSDEVDEWIKQDGSSDWMDFLRKANGLTPLAVTSGNPRSTVALVGDGAYRRFGTDNSRSRFAFEEGTQRIGGVRLRLELGASSINTSKFDDDLYTIDPTLTVAGDLGRYVGLSGSVIGQYRNYNDGEIYDLGFELGLPITLSRTDRSPWYWQFTPVVQVAAGASVDLAAGGLFMGGGVVHALGYNFSSFELLMANQILYYGGIPIDDIGGYDFDTKLSQLYFKNGLEATWHPLWGLYLDVGIDFTNFAIDEAAIPFYFSPAVGVGWKISRWIDLRASYHADLDGDDYTAHNLRAKLEFLF